jgi:hypothetical protein
LRGYNFKFNNAEYISHFFDTFKPLIVTSSFEETNLKRATNWQRCKRLPLVVITSELEDSIDLLAFA